MLESMTGFAAKESELTLDVNTAVHAGFILKSLNGRYFEAHCKLPQSISAFETQIIKILKNKLKRGSIFFTAHLGSGNALKTDIRPALPLIGKYIDAIKKAQEIYPINGDVSVAELIRLPHVFETYEPLLKDTLKDQIFSIVNQLIEDLIEARHKEGADLKLDLLKRLFDIGTYLDELEPRALVVMENKKKEIHQLIAQAQDETGDNEINVTSAFYSALDKIDIHEEITRFKSLSEQLKIVIDNKTHEKGKKIDFTLQELFREINTITSKCSDSQISRLAIDIKVELEKARELAQNIL